MKKPAKKKPARKAPAKKKAVPNKKAAANKKPARKLPAKKKAAPKKKTASRKPAAKKAARKRTPAKQKRAVKKSAAKKKTASRKPPAKKKAARIPAPEKQSAATKKRAPLRPLKQKAFLAAYVACGNISDAARKVKCGRCAHYEWMKDAAYAEAFTEAHEQACDAVDSEIRRRAVKGLRKPVFHNGEIVGMVREYSDTLLIFLAKSLRPERYRDNVKVEHSGSAELLEILEAGRERVAKLDESRK